MPTYKRIDGDYNITTLNPSDNVVVTTHTLEVRGNLDVAGNLTYINVTELNVRDPFILLNSSNTGSYASNSGVLVHETSTNFAGIRYNATANRWELSVNTDNTGIPGTWDAITTGSMPTGAAGANTEIQFNQGGLLAANAAFTFDQTTGQVAVDGHVTLITQPSEPAPLANASIVYANTPGSGDSGVYYVTSATNADELISATRAKLYSIIF